MAPTLPSFDVRRLRSYVFRLPLLTRIVLILVALFWVLELQQIWNVVQWGALIPDEINFGTTLVPLLERFESEHGTLLTGAMFAGRMSKSA
ncbi:MAG: hypothetical protein L6R37_002249 [Teloschistes peruensis]|nr:MAG: hypothetical protein L6R37_002249 [Teloschistes peruensis]